MKNALLYTICLIWFSTYATAQNKAWDGFGIEGYYIAGKAFKHSSKMRADFPEQSPAFELNFVQQTYGRKAWHQRRRYPVVGMSIGYTVYDKDVVYGRSFSLTPNIRIPIISGKKLEWSFRAGFGLGYITKRFSRHPDWDTLNTAMSSRINNYSYFTTDLRYRVNKHLDILAGVNFAHISNAALKQPNLGINKYGAHLGVRYSPVSSTPDRIVRKQAPLKNRVLAQVRLSMTGKEIGTADGPMYPIYMASAFASKRYWSKNKILLGVDYEYQTNIYMFLKNNEIHPGKEKQNSWKSSAFIGNEFLLGRVGIMFQVGYYLKQDAFTKQKLYQKLGGNLYIIQKESGVIKELGIHAFLKTHTSEAELVETGINLGF